MPSGSRSARQGPQPAATSVPDCPAKSRPVEQRRQVLSRRTVGDRPAVSREPRNGANRRSFESAERGPTEEKRNIRRGGSFGSSSTHKEETAGAGGGGGGGGNSGGDGLCEEGRSGVEGASGCKENAGAGSRIDRFVVRPISGP
ncbi:MAG: hypothetical protein M1815_004499 [Lichina confinis]|nr:MAG: hypothetical protein M1815_004499 [Lichina confinis]